MTSQCDRILRVLEDGNWHRMEEVHQRVGFCRLNSRISELRHRGHNIVCDKSRGVYKYRLLEEPDVAAASPPSGSSSESVHQDGSAVSTSPQAQPTQLSVWEAA